MATNNDPARFNWTEEERILLRDTLRVKVLEEDRIEIEAREPREPIAELFGLVVLLFAVVFLAHEVVDPTPTMFLWVSFLCLLVVWAIPFGPIQRCRGSLTTSVSFFPGTQWCIRHRGLPEGALELVSLALSSPFWGIFRQQLVFETDIGAVQLKQRRRLRWTASFECHNLLRGRLQGKTYADRWPPPHVADLAEAGALALPRRRYVALLKNLDVVSVGLDSLALRTNLGAFRRFRILYAADFVLWIVLIILSAVGILPEHLPWGSGHYIALRTVMLLGIPFTVGFLQREWVKRSPGPDQRDVITISKRSPQVMIRGPRGERSLNRSDCWLTRIPGNDGDDDTILLQQGENCLARWQLADLEHPGPDGEAIMATVASYFGDPIQSNSPDGER